MKAFPLIAALLALAPRPTLGAETIATVLGKTVTREDIGPVNGDAAAVAKLYDLLWPSLSRHYLEERGLTATAGDIAEAVEHHRQFAARDRAQRTRKLAELEKRLADDSLSPGDRAWLEDFRGVLLRLAQSDAEQESLPPPDPERQKRLLVPWIETWKLNQALYREYGGVVALTFFGPDPHGARTKLVADYERRGLLKFQDAALREQLYGWLGRHPSMVTAPQDVDFTPYWKKPIPPSYFPD